MQRQQGSKLRPTPAKELGAVEKLGARLLHLRGLGRALSGQESSCGTRGRGRLALAATQAKAAFTSSG